LAYNIVYKISVDRDLRRIPKVEARRNLDEMERELPKKADEYPVLKKQFAGLRRYRVGDYRVIHAILEDNVLVLRIGHRQEVYRKGL
jgi:mRNA-degrading endonuclease RelE of RelBE toxin-antitoxin system